MGSGYILCPQVLPAHARGPLGRRCSGRFSLGTAFAGLDEVVTRALGGRRKVSRTVHRVGVSRVVSWDPGFPRRAAGEE